MGADGELPQPDRIQFNAGLSPSATLVANRIRERIELLLRKPAQQVRIGQIAALVVVEQVSPDESSGGLVVLDADEPHQRAAGRLDLARREHALERRRRPIPRLRGVPRPFLRGMVVAQRQRHQLLQVDTALAI